MRFEKVALLAGALAVMGCSGGERSADTTTAVASGSPSTGAAAAPTPAASGSAATTAAEGAPITGTIHEVKMLGDAQGYRYDPVNLTIKAGDGVKWVLVSGPPHNVAFQSVPAAAKAQLIANMPDESSGELSSAMYMNAGEGFTMSFGGVPPGKYDYICVPHLAMGMKGSITVQ